MMKQKIKWSCGQQVMFIDDQRRPSDDKMKRMPQLGEVCTVRKVLKSFSCDTGEPGVGLYLEGFVNPLDDDVTPVNGDESEYCFEAERFVPLNVIQQLLEKETSWTVDLPPNRQPLTATIFLRGFADYLGSRDCWYQVDLNKGIVEATLPSRFGDFPLKVTHLGKGRFESTCEIPIRHPLTFRTRVWELLDRMNQNLSTGSFKPDLSRSTVFHKLPFVISVDEKFPDFVMCYCLHEINRLYRPFTDLIFRGLTPEEAAQRQFEIDENGEVFDSWEQLNEPDEEENWKDKMFRLMIGHPENN